MRVRDEGRIYQEEVDVIEQVASVDAVAAG